MRCVVIGIGRLAMDNYLPLLSEMPDLELAYYSRTPASRVAAVAQFGGTYLDSWEAIAAFKPDIAFNLTTDTQHADVLDRLVALRVPRIFTEKPFVSAHGQERVDEDDFERALTIANAAKAAKLEIALGFNYRFFDTVRSSLDVMEANNFGTPSTVVASAHYACWSHTIDLIGMVCGRFAAVSALGESAPEGAAVADSSSMETEITPSRAIAFTTESGAVGTLSGTARRAWNDELFSVSFLSPAGRIEWSDLDVESHSFDAATGRHSSTRLGAGDSRWSTYSRSFVSSVTAYLDAVRADAPAPVGLDAGLQELQVEAAIARSIATGRVIDVQREFPLPA